MILSMCLSTPNVKAGFLNEQMTWTYGAFDNFTAIPSLRSVSITTLQGDTLINGYVYKKVMIDGYYWGAIREEGKKWFVVNSWISNQELTLYDFSAKLGDTIYHYSDNQHDFQKSIVTNVDSITLENGERRLRLTNHYGVWIEGIGDTHALLKPVLPLTLCKLRCVGCIGSMETLLCYKQQGVVLYSNLANAPNGCTYKVGQNLDEVDQSKELKCLLTRDGMLEYKLPDRTQVINNVKLISLSGFTVWEARAGFEDGGGRIPVSHLAHGIYMLRVKSTQGVVMQKVSL